MANRCHFLAVGNKKAGTVAPQGQLIEIIQIIKSSVFQPMADGR
jgi:hypothetical protein